MKRQAICLTNKGLRWYRTGHPWVFRDDIVEHAPEEKGEIVAVENDKGRMLGRAFYNPDSKISLRLITRNEEAIDEQFWRRRLERAIRLRRRTIHTSDAYRLVFSESDGIPGLIVDHYAGHLVAQTLAIGADRLRHVFARILIELLNPHSLIFRNDASMRTLEGLPLEKERFHNAPPERIEVSNSGTRILVDVRNGQKTGLYLDQRENHVRARELARGRVLDLFCYQGGFSLQVVPAAEHVVAVDSSRDALDVLRLNLKINDVTNVAIVEANVFDWMRRISKEETRFDLVILDPPPFAPTVKDRIAAYRGHKELHLRALKSLAAGGRLITCCCSYHVSEEYFLRSVWDAAKDVGRAVWLVEKRMQALDHPILIGFPESYYLKCLIFRVS
jgi:23S rRNA (cytosine1962-C5)-methyltransferase